MKEIYRCLDESKVLFYANTLESHGIKVIVRNAGIATIGLTSIPISEFFPNICVLDEDQYAEAWNILKELDEPPELEPEDIICSQCSEPNPSSFEICYKCESELGRVETER